jgi:predicted nucleic acid-binding protein
MQTIFIDTNVFLRVLVREDEKAFGDCKALLGAIREGKYKAVTSGLVLAEMVWVLRSYYGVERNEVCEKLKGMLALKNLRIVDGYDHGLAVKLYSEHNVKFIDACIASISQVREKKVTVVSYDKDFDSLEVRRVEPGELI